MLVRDVFSSHLGAKKRIFSFDCVFLEQCGEGACSELKLEPFGVEEDSSRFEL